MANPFKDYTIHLPAGELVFQEGEARTMMYVIQSGSVELYREADGRRISYGTLERGDFFGEMSLLLERQPRTTCAVTLEDAELVEIGATLFDKMIRGNIEIAVRMMRKISLRLREYEERGEALEAAPVEPSVPEADDDVSVPPETVEEEEIPVAREPPRLSHRRPQPGPAPGRSLSQVREDVPGAHAIFATEDGSNHFPLERDEASLGRFDPVTGMRPEVDVSAIDINRSVSRHHARLVRDGDTYTLTEEVGALNGTFVNSERLVTGKPTPVGDGDAVGLGRVKLRFHVLDKS